MAFWILAAVMTLAALGFVLLPLLRDPAHSQRRRAEAALRSAAAAGALSEVELQAKLARLPAASAAAHLPRATAALLALMLPFCAAALYYWKGEPRALDAINRMPLATAANDADGNPPPSMEQAVAGLAERLRDEPDNLEGWLLLGRAYKTMERFEQAREALSNAIRLAPSEPDVMVEYAEALALASSTRRIDGDALQLIESAIAAQPDHQRGLWLLGVAAMQAQRPADAVKHWESLRVLIAADAAAVASLDQQIEGARQAAGLPPAENSTAVVEAGNTPTTPSSNGPTLTVRVDVAESLKARIGTTDTLFVFARAANGSKMPLAIERLSAAQLPVTVTLDDADSMMPELKLSLMPQVVVGARISKSGQAVPQSGDLEVFSAPVANSHSDTIDLVINAVVP